jgi:flagellar biosynthetic protein FliO
VAGGGWSVLASRRAGDGEQAARQAADPDASFLSDPNLASASVSLDNRELFLKMMFAVALVIGLGLAVLYLSKRVLPRITNAPGKEIRILETAYLGPRKALHLVEVANQRLLIASTNDGVTMLTHVGEGTPNAIESVGDPDTWLDLPRQEMDAAGKA